MEEFPSDVLSNIFIRLFAKQLAQMRSVNKSWNALLSTKSFIKSHLHRSFHNNDEILLLFYGKFSNFRLPAFSARSSKSPDLELTDFVKSPVKSQDDIDKVIGSVNGLICFKKHSWPEDCVIHIWNPSLSAILALPPYSMPYPATTSGYDPLRVEFRFGYDPKADDYKVVRLAFLLQPPGYYRVQEWLPLEVYSMRKGSWKPITQSFPSHFTRISTHEEEQVCVDGHDGLLHWLGIIGEDKKARTIVAFDLGAETFHEMPLPDTILQYDTSNHTNILGVLAGKLCVMSYVYAGECEVWVMDEYGVAESWVKNHVFSQFHNIVPLGFTLRNEFLFQIDDDDDETVGDVDYGDRCFGLYDPVAATTKFFKMIDPLRAFVGYVDSLVWVAPDERVITTKKRGNFRKRGRNFPRKTDR